MKKNEKLITGLAAVAAVGALLLIPKTRKMMSDAFCAIKGSAKKAAGKAEQVIAHA